jgi:hypothetical protein
VLALTVACGGDADPSAPQPCNSGGFCKDPAAPSGGATRWVRQFGTTDNEQVVAVATRGDGVSAALARSYGAVEESTLTWLGPDGSVLLSRAYPGAVETFWASIAFGPGGDVYLWVDPMRDVLIAPRTSHPDFGGGAISGATVVRLSATGDFRWQRLLSNQETETDEYALRTFPDSPIALDAAGNVAVSTRGSFGSTVHRCNADGTLAWSRDFAAFTKVAFAPDGGLYVAEDGYPKSDSIPMWTHDSFGVIWKLDATGATAWQAALEGGDWASVTFDAVGASALGTVAASGGFNNGSITFAGTALTAPPPDGFLAAVEPDGTPRFLRDAGRPAARGAENAVHPDGSVAIVVDDLGRCGFEVQLWGLDGNRRWSRDFTAPTCDSYTAPLWRRLAYGAAVAPDGTVLVGGLLRLPMDFGFGLFLSRGGEVGLFGGGDDGFVLALTP